jgi:cytochrome oxidase Cu insertion factor (SCO1/SenC/PrrC family)
MKEFILSFKILFTILFLILFLPITSLASGEGKTDIKAMSNSSVTSTEGQSIQLGSTWQEKPVVLVFIRHFG